MRHKAYSALVEAMKAEPRDFTLDEIYRLVCRPPHQEMLSVVQLHSRVSRSVGEARQALKKDGFVLIPGAARNSYRAVRRVRGK